MYKLSPSERTDEAYPTLKHYYDNQKKQYENLSNLIYFKDKFNTYNVNAKLRKHGVSSQISESKQIETVDRILCKHEYAMQEYESSYNYDEWFDMFRKISRGSIWDKNHYPNKAIIAAYKKLEELYEKIASDNDYIIDRYLLLDEIECSSRIEIYYKWLKAYKRNQKNINSDIIK